MILDRLFKKVRFVIEWNLVWIYIIINVLNKLLDG